MYIMRSAVFSFVLAAAALACNRDQNRNTTPAPVSATTAHGTDVGNPTDTSGGMSSETGSDPNRPSSSGPTTGTGMDTDTGTGTGMGSDA